MNSSVELSIVIVNYKVRDFLAQTIRSLRSAQGYDRCEVIVVDNDSNDGSEELVVNEFPEVNWIGLKTNVGFGKGCNIGAEQANSSLLLMLNPDTIVSVDTLVKGIEFMAANPDVGILGPKVLNQDGSFYKQCHRGLPTPINAFGHFTKLSKLFPKNQKLSSYFMSWLSPDDEHEIDAVSGSCFFIPTDLYKTIGGFDETFFMYGEDLDICVQVKLQGKKVWYAPISKIIHFQGKSSVQRKLKSKMAFYNAMIIFSRKYKDSYSSFFPAKMIEVAVFFQAFLSGLIHVSKQLPSILLDLLIINALIPISAMIRYQLLNLPNPYPTLDFLLRGSVHLIASLSLTIPFLLYDMVKKRHTSYVKPAVVGLGFYLSTLFLAHNIAFSRIALVISVTCSLLLMMGWRFWIPRFSNSFDRLINQKGKTVLISEEPLLNKLFENTEVIQSTIVGIVATAPETQREMNGYPVLGSLSQLTDIVENHSVNRIIIASTSDWYSVVIDALSAGNLKKVTIQWLVPNDPNGELKEFSLS